MKGLTLAELVHVYDVRRLLEVEAARLGAQQIGPADVDRMQTEYELMRAAIAERRVVALLDHDEALLTILYEAAANPVLVDSIRSLWQHCRACKDRRRAGHPGHGGRRLVVEVPGTSRRGRPQG